MRGPCGSYPQTAREIERTLVQGTARLCISPFGLACKAVWPHKTAEKLAAESGQAVRTCAYELAGDREPSGRSYAALFAKLMRWPL